LILFLFLVSPVEIPQEAFEVALMFGCSFMVGFLKLRISNEYLAVLAPVFGL